MKQTTSAAEMAELTTLYEDAWGEGIWVKEFGCVTGHLAGAGFVADLELLKKVSGEEFSVDRLTLGDCVNMSAPGNGATRIEACRNAIAALKALDRTHFLREKEEGEP